MFETSSYLAACRVGRDGSNVLDAADGHASAGKSAESTLGTRTGGLGASTASGTKLDVEGVYADLAATGSDVLSGQHGGVRRRLVTIGLDLHTTGDSGNGFTTGEIGDVDESVVEGGEDVGDTEDELALSNLGTERNGLFLLDLDLLGGLHPKPR